MAPTDPTQFAPTPAMAQQDAIQRRLSGTNTSPIPLTNNATQTSNGVVPLPNWNDPGGNPSLTPQYYQNQYNQQHPVNPNMVANPNNPLAGGTGDPALDQFLGTDTTYQGQLSDLMRQYDQYNAQKNLQATQTQADFDAKQRALNTQAGLDRQQMMNNFASRGILNSGIYANSLGQYNQNNQQQMTNLLGGFQNSQDNANLAYAQFVANEIAAKNTAIQQAAARRAAQLGQF